MDHKYIEVYVPMSQELHIPYVVRNSCRQVEILFLMLYYYASLNLANNDSMHSTWEKD